MGEDKDELDDMLGRYYDAPCETDEHASAPLIAWTRPGMRLENIGLDKAFAAYLSVGVSGERCELIKTSVPLLREAVALFFSFARETTASRFTEMSEAMVSVVATPGTTEKKKVFEHQVDDSVYVRHVTRLFLFLFRVHLAHANGVENVGDGCEFPGEVHLLIHNILGRLWENLDPGPDCPEVLAEGRTEGRACYIGCPDCTLYSDDSGVTIRDNRNPGLEDPNSPTPNRGGWHGDEPFSNSAKSSRVYKNSIKYCQEVTPGLEPPIVPGELEDEPCSWEDGVVRVMFTLLQFIFLQPVSVKAEDRASVAYLYTTTLLAVRDRGDTVRFALGRDISQPIAGLLHSASLMAILHILVWPDCEDGENQQLAVYRKLFQPGEMIGIGALVSMMSKCSKTRDLENSVPTWTPCSENGRSDDHKYCGFVHGQHFSPAMIGDTVVKIQIALWRLLVGPNGLFDHNEINDGFLEMLTKAQDDPDDRTPNFCFMDDIRNHVLRAREKIVVDHWLTLFRSKTEGMGDRVNVARDLLLQIRRISQLLQTLLYMTGGACVRGTEMAEMSVRNTESNPLRSFLFMNGKMVCLPTHTKLTWNQFLTLRTVSRNPEPVSVLL